MFRIGGDEFAAVMMNDDFANRDDLISRFFSEQEVIPAFLMNSIQQIDNNY